MASLNITYQGRSADVPLDLEVPLSDADVRRIAVELVRSGAVPGLQVDGLPDQAFEHFVVDRFDGPAGLRLFLRPKVPFGGVG